jgi:hypothetical protein
VRDCQSVRGLRLADGWLTGEGGRDSGLGVGGMGLVFGGGLLCQCASVRVCGGPWREAIIASLGVACGAARGVPSARHPSSRQDGRASMRAWLIVAHMGHHRGIG